MPLTHSLLPSPASRGRPAGGGKPKGAAGLSQQLHPPGLLFPSGTQWGKAVPRKGVWQRERLEEATSLHMQKVGGPGGHCGCEQELMGAGVVKVGLLRRSLATCFTSTVMLVML